MTYLKLSYVDRNGESIRYDHTYLERVGRAEITDIINSLDYIREDLLDLRGRMD